MMKKLPEAIKFLSLSVGVCIYPFLFTWLLALSSENYNIYAIAGSVIYIVIVVTLFNYLSKVQSVKDIFLKGSKE